MFDAGGRRWYQTKNCFISNTAILPQGRLGAEKNIRLPNYKKPPEDGSRYKRKSHYHDYKSPVLSLSHTTEPCLFTKIGAKNQKCVCTF
jgi:hypothetical protein